MKMPRSRRSPWMLGLFGLLLLAFLPELASAQPNALFPEIYIKRKRPCPEQENPQYRMIREQFYGYYPTCWRKFPEGWGCQSADAPNWKASLDKQKLDIPDGMEAAENAPDQNAERPDPFGRGRPKPADEGNQPAMPEPPDEPESLFPETNPTSGPPADGGIPTGNPGLVKPPATNPDDPFKRAGSRAALDPAGNYPPQEDDSTLLVSLPAMMTASDSPPLPNVNPTPTAYVGETGKPAKRGPVSQFINRLRRK